jgi:hypothetical protein
MCAEHDRQLGGESALYGPVRAVVWPVQRMPFQIERSNVTKKKAPLSRGQPFGLSRVDQGMIDLAQERYMKRPLQWLRKCHIGLKTKGAFSMMAFGLGCLGGRAIGSKSLPGRIRTDTASVGTPIDGDPVANGAAHGIGRTGLVSRLIRARLLVAWPFFTRSENMPWR